MSFNAEIINMKPFMAQLNEYMKFQKRLPADVINAKLFFIARNATMTTKAGSKDKIHAELLGPSQTYPSAPLAGIIVNTQLAKKGKKGLSGHKMELAMQRLLKFRDRSLNFVRAGYKNGILILEQCLQSTGEMRFVRRQGNVKQDPATLRKKVLPSFGTAIPARVNSPTGQVFGEISNNVHGSGKHTHTLNIIKIEGLQKAVDREAASMAEYIARKHNEKTKY